MILYDGRPESTEGRLPREVRTYDYLDKLGIGYQRTDHEAANTMEACNNGKYSSMQPAEDELLSSDDAGRQEVQDQGALGADQLGEAVVRGTGGHAQVSRH